MPLGISADSPRPAPLGASLLSSTGSSLVSGTKIPRLTASSSFDRAPAGTRSLGNSLIFTASGVMLAPRGRSTTATTTGTETTTGTTALLGSCARCINELTNTAAEPPRINASATSSSDRTLMDHLDRTLMDHLVSLYFKAPRTVFDT